MKKELTRCKCGGKGSIFSQGIADWYIECRKCGTKEYGDTKKEAVDNWEKRMKK